MPRLSFMSASPRPPRRESRREIAIADLLESGVVLVHARDDLRTNLSVVFAPSVRQRSIASGRG